MSKEKQKITLEQYFAKRKVHVPNKFIYFLCLNLVVKPFLKRKFHIETIVKDKIDCDSGAFLIFNHQSRADFVSLCCAAAPRRLTFVIGYNEFFRAKFKLPFQMLQCIPKKNFTEDFPSLREIDRIIKQKGVVTFSPEGMSSIVGHNQPIVNGTGNYFKHYGVPVYIQKIKGGYLTNHKVCLDDRIGKIVTETKLLLSVEQLKTMSAEEIDNLINEELWQDDYEWQKEQHIKWNTKGRICYHLNDILFKCPKCGSEHQMRSDDNIIYCENCSNGATMDEYYVFHPINKACIIPDTPSRWFDWEREEIIKAIRVNENYSFSENVKLGLLPKYKRLTKGKTSEIVGKGRFVFDHKGIHFKGDMNGKPYSFELSYEKIYSLVIVTDCTKFGFYIKGVFHEFYPESPSVGKILLIVEEMHRLHVNSWKNFPRYNYMYENANSQEDI